MKKFLLIAAALCLSYVVNAQELGKTFIGVKGGINATNIGGKETDNALKIGGHFGVFAQSHVVDPLDFRLELLLSGQGHAPKTDLDNKLKLTYLNIPILAQLYPADKFSVYAGPQFGFLLSAKAEYQDLTIKVKDNFKGFDLGFALGAGYDIHVLDRDLNLSLRYIHGLTNISKDSASKRFNRVFQLSLGIWLFETVQ